MLTVNLDTRRPNATRNMLEYCNHPNGTTLSELFPTTLRYSGTSLTFNLAAIFGASLAPYIATELAKVSLSYVGLYLSGSAVLSLIGLAATRETRHGEL